MASDQYYTITVRRAIVYMQERINQKISLNEVADYVGISSTHLSRLLKKETGKSFVDLNNQMKIQLAIELLRTGEYKVCEVAQKIGINNYAYFYQLFKKITGKSPKEYQKW